MIGLRERVKKSILSVCSVSRVRLFVVPVGGSPPGSSVQGFLQARILKWVAIPFFRDLPDQGVKLGSPALQADSLLSEPTGKPKTLTCIRIYVKNY